MRRDRGSVVLADGRGGSGRDGVQGGEHARFDDRALGTAVSLFWASRRSAGRRGELHPGAIDSPGDCGRREEFKDWTLGGAREIWLLDGDKHASPNAGQCEAAMAGALGVRLGGRNSYEGQVHDAPHLYAEGRPASVRDARAALSMVAMVSALAFGAGILVAFARDDGRGSRTCAWREE